MGYLKRRHFTTEEIQKREAYLEKLSGGRFKEDLKALNSCSYTFGRNGVELEAHIRKFMGAPVMARELSEDFENELVRLLHNFLTSVTSLMDAQRVTMRHRWPDEGKTPRFAENEYADAIARIFRPGESEFLVKLRSYCTHRSIVSPGLVTTMHWEQGSPVIQSNTLR